MNIHLISDQKFIDIFIERFDKYHKNNRYIVTSFNDHTEIEYINNNIKKIEIINVNKVKWSDVVQDFSESDNLIIHYLKGSKVKFAYELLNRISLKSYWIFYGSELYSYLYKNHTYDLYDYKINKRSYYNSFKKKLQGEIKKILNYGRNNGQDNFLSVVEKINYFCFWNEYDFKLAKSFLPGSFKFSFFRYFMFNVFDIDKYRNIKTLENNLMINHSSSLTGNHLTILNKLNKVMPNNYFNRIILPLSYGHSKHSDEILEYGENQFKKEFYPIINFLDKEEYFKLICSCKFAIFGHKRQEAGNNIFFLIGIGVKVFLRPESNIFKYLLDRGFKVFDYNKITGPEDFLELSEQEKSNNYHLLIREFNSQQVTKAYKDFFTNEII